MKEVIFELSSRHVELMKITNVYHIVLLYVISYTEITLPIFYCRMLHHISKSTMLILNAHLSPVFVSFGLSRTSTAGLAEALPPRCVEDGLVDLRVPAGHALRGSGSKGAVVL